MTDPEELVAFDSADHEPETGTSVAFSAVRQRCDAAGIRVTEEKIAPNRSWLYVWLPRGGRGHQTISIGSNDDAEALLHLPFEDLRFVGAYEAIVSYRQDEIEATVRRAGPGPAVRGEFFKRAYPSLVTAEGDVRLLLADETRAPGVEVELSQATTALVRLTRPIFRQNLSLKIRGLGLSRHAAALDALDAISSALFFDLDQALGLPLDLQRMRNHRPMRSRSRRSVATPKLPTNRYDHEAATLFRYARSAVGMPLLQFLGYYQAIEFFMPRYTQAETRNRIVHILKDPTFDPHDARAITRLLGVATDKQTSGSRDERSQLRLVLRACVDSADLAEFISDSRQREEFFRSKRSSLTAFSLSTKNESVDLRDQTADRIYDLRCKIVHTKDSQAQGQLDLLLPNSPEADMLHDDIELLRFLATRTLVAGSASLSYRFT